ncbi:MraY family glycosyltransferase [Diaminobutyricimonas aerilata]|uniref:MraY family glycosyltransferase n=1 Tax=Diaminobutyricimonas aerilata TaxID=1162967 RepID=UPI000C2366BA
MVFYALVGVVSAGSTAVLAYVTWRLGLRFKLYPKIRDRDVHTSPTPRLGGVAMFLGVLAALALASQLDEFDIVFDHPDRILAILLAALLIVVVGVVDDLWDLDWTIKLGAQILAGGVLAWGGIQLVSLPIVVPSETSEPVVGVYLLSPTQSFMLTVLAVVLVMNAMNFIDGLDGLVAGVAMIASGVFFIYAYLLQAGGRTEYFNLASLLTVLLGGACLGFIPYNWRVEVRGQLKRPARLFMGDSGALLVGLLMAASAIAVTTQVDPQTISRSQLLPSLIPIILPFAILVVPLLDFGLAVVRRLGAGKSPFSADRRHLHHRLLDMGHTHQHAVFIFYAWTTVVAVGCLLPLFVHWAWALAFISVGLVACTVVTLLPLTRRKAVETAVQSLSPDELGADEATARFDPLDEASNEIDDQPDPRQTDAALRRLKDRKE